MSPARRSGTGRTAEAPSRVTHLARLTLAARGATDAQTRAVRADRLPLRVDDAEPVHARPAGKSRRAGRGRAAGQRGRRRAAGHPRPVAGAGCLPAVAENFPLARAKGTARLASTRGGDLIRADFAAARPGRRCHRDDGADSENHSRQNAHCAPADHRALSCASRPASRFQVKGALPAM